MAQNKKSIWEPAEEKVRRLRLLDKAPNSIYNRLVVRYPYQTDSDYARFYFDSAERLAGTFDGNSEDDMLLLPFLMLYRHAFELELKSFIKELIRLRKVYLGHSGLDYTAAELAERLRKKHGHRLLPLVTEVKKHWDELDFSEPFPEEVAELLEMLHEMDGSGMSFRYAGHLPDYQNYVDFPDLVEMLNEAKEQLDAAYSYAVGSYDAMPTLRELM
jgi:hypothetical protein